jgi:hypothetical protein
VLLIIGVTRNEKSLKKRLLIEVLPDFCLKLCVGKRCHAIPTCGTLFLVKIRIDKIMKTIRTLAGGLLLLAISTLNVQLSTCFAQGVCYTNWDDLVTNWVQTTAPGGWSVVSSADGIRLAVAVSGGGIYTSTSSGVAWTQTSAPTTNWVAIASSADGTRLAAAVNGGGIYTSTNSGVAWTQTSAPATNWVAIASSADGIKLAAVGYWGAAAYTSTNSGATWTSHGVSPIPQYAAFLSIASCADGTKLAVGALTGAAQLYISSDSGESWAQAGTPYAHWVAVASSADGSKLAAEGEDLGDFSLARIYTSSDSGLTWTQTSAPATNWHSIACSADGTKLAAAAVGGGIYISIDSGVTWTPTTAPSNGWSSITMSADGTKLAAVNGDGIWTSHARIIPVVPPVLNIASAGNQNVLYWPAWASDYVLECASDLSSTNWTAVTNGTPVIAITVTNAPPAQFFRLRQY